MKIRISLFILFLLLSLISFCQTKNDLYLTKIPLKNHFDPLIYNGGLQNWGFDQDQNGVLFVANDQGLLEFDGNKWVIHKLPLATRTRSVFIESNDRIFVGGDNQVGYFVRSDQGIQFISFKKELEKNNISANEILKIIKADGSLYFLTRESKILRYSDAGFKGFEGPGYIQNIFNHQEDLIVQVYNQGLFKLEDNNFLRITGTSKTPEISEITTSGNNNSLMFCKNGTVFSFASKSIIKDYSKAFGEVNAVQNLSKGGYAVGTQNKGLYILDSNLEIEHHFTKNRGLTGATVKAVHEDQFKNLWVGLNNGIDYLKVNLPFRLINDESGVEGTGYCATTFNERTFLGTNNGVFFLKATANETIDTFKLLEGSEGQVWGFSKVHDNLILNHQNGAFLIDDQELTQFHDIGSWLFVETQDPNIILGGDYQGVKYFEKQGQSWRFLKQIPNLNESSRILHFENDTTLWMSHGYKGAYKIQFDKDLKLKKGVTRFGQNNGFPSDILISSYRLNGRLIFTSEDGTFNYVQDSLMFRPNKFLDSLLGKSHISNIKQKGNDIYFIQNNEIGRLEEKRFGEYNKETAIFKHVNKLINFDLDNISILDAKNILIGAKNGFIHYDPSVDYHVVNNFQTIIKSVRILRSEDSIQTISPTKNIRLEKENKIDISFVSPYFENTEDLKYSYRFLPVDDNWSEPTSINQKSYAYLPFGKYDFEVKAINLYGEESNISRYSFEIITPWYASNLAKIFYAILFLILVVLFPLIQQKRFKEEKLTLEKSKKMELEVKNKKIDSLYNENLKNELNLKNNQLTAITMQLLKNKEFILDVQQKISTAVSKTNSEKDLKRLVKTIDLELSNIDYWDQFSYHFEQVHGNYLNKIKDINVKLSPNELKLVAFLRMNMSSKEISKLMNITVRGVEIARYRLRKKFNLERSESLVNFLISLEKTQDT